MKLLVNGQGTEVHSDPQKPLLWVLREDLELTGTKFGCGVGQCRACTVHVDGQAVPACITPTSYAEGKSVTTIEGVWNDAETRRVPQEWIEQQVPQCGYCQSGQIMAAVALLESNPSPSDTEINDAMRGNVCRCGTYTRIRKAIRSLRDSRIPTLELSDG